MASDTYSKLIPGIYEASIDPNKWVSNLDGLARLVGARGGALLLLETLDVYRYSINFLSSHYQKDGQIHDLMIEYQNDYSSYEKEVFTGLGKAEPFTLFKDLQFDTGRESILKRPDVAFLHKNFGVLDRFGVSLNSEKEYFNAMTFQYDSSRGNVTNQEWQSLIPLFAHIKTATYISRTFTILKSRYDAVLSVLNRVNMAYAISLSNGEVIVLNDSAKATLDKKDGLSFSKDRRIKTVSADLNSEIHSAILAASQTVSGSNNSASKLLVIPRRSNKQSFLLEISPLRDSTKELDDFLTGALITIIDPEEQTSVSTKGLKELYGLTGAESAIADLMVKGMSNQSISEIRGVTMGTIKSQIKSVLSKTDTKNRTDLIRRVLSINIPIK